jgi:hypothetical protein
MFDDLDPYGAWYESAQFGVVWRPGVGVGWQPYYQGHWIWTTYGWMWVSYDPFGWATYHYGNWWMDPMLGWVWVPGYQWSACPVDWYDGGGWIGWAPVPPPGCAWDDPWNDGGRYRDGWVVVETGKFKQVDVGDNRLSPQKIKSVYRSGAAVREAPKMRSIELATRQSVKQTDVRIDTRRVGNHELRTVVGRARAFGVPVHSDAVQAVGKVPVRVGGDEGPDLLTATGHKIHGPKGTGILYVRRGVALHPLLFGGGQERGLRPGTQDVAGARGMARALELAVSERDEEAPRLYALRDRLEASLLERIEGLVVHGGESERAPHVSNVGVPGVDQDILLAGLDRMGLAVSSGSACNSGVTRASYVLRALYGGGADERATVRLSLGRDVTAADVDRAAEMTADMVARIRERSQSATRAAHASSLRPQ